MHCLGGPERVEWGGGASGCGQQHPLHQCVGQGNAYETRFTEGGSVSPPPDTGGGRREEASGRI